MNRKPQVLQTRRAIEGFLQFKQAEGLSQVTVDGYARDLDLWIEYQGNQFVDSVTSEQILNYLNYLRTDYVPRRITGGNENKLSPKTIRNHYVTLCSFFTWASSEFDISSPMKKVPAPRVQDAPIEPFTREEIEALLKVCSYAEEAKTNNRRKFVMRRPTAERDRALILTLLDTGLRASELCSLRVSDLDLKTGHIGVRHGIGGGAKGKKGRSVYVGKSARRSLWRYLAEREDVTDENAPLFLGKFNRPLNKDALRQLINALGKRANVKKCYPHRFRHTFAITYLRSGGDLFTLKSLLGHKSLEMVEHYARIAEVDVAAAHRRASPADNWRL